MKCLGGVIPGPAVAQDDAGAARRRLDAGHNLDPTSCSRPTTWSPRRLLLRATGITDGDPDERCAATGPAAAHDHRWSCAPQRHDPHHSERAQAVEATRFLPRSTSSTEPVTGAGPGRPASPARCSRSVTTSITGQVEPCHVRGG
jgi:hypothetical protein